MPYYLRVAHLALQNLTKSFGKGRNICHALRGVSLEASRELLVVLGPSGSGKTTLLRLVAGLDSPDQGSVQLDGRPMDGLPPSRRDLAMVFQQSALYPHLSVQQNLALALKSRRVPHPEIEMRVREASQSLNLSSLLERYPAQLSGGEQQRVALARALARRPRLLLLDEPLANLDLPMRQSLSATLARVQAESDMTMIYVTHDQAEAMALGHRIALLNQGQLEQIGSPEQLYQHPRNQFVASFLGNPPMNLFGGHLRDKETEMLFCENPTSSKEKPDPFTVRLPPSIYSQLQQYRDRPVQLGLRPEHFSFEPLTSSPDSSPEWTATFQRAVYTGADYLLVLATQTHSFILRSAHCGTLQPGQLLVVQPDLARACFFDETGNALG